MIDTALDLEPSEKKEHLKNLDFRPWTKTKNQIWCQRRSLEFCSSFYHHQNLYFHIKTCHRLNKILNQANAKKKLTNHICLRSHRFRTSGLDLNGEKEICSFQDRSSLSQNFLTSVPIKQQNRLLPYSNGISDSIITSHSPNSTAVTH